MAKLTIDGKQYGVPYTYYQWGVYYRKDIYDELGLSEPSNFEELKANCQAILDSGPNACELLRIVRRIRFCLTQG